MKQQFETSCESVTPLVSAPGDTAHVAASASLSPAGQQTVSAYFAQMEADLVRRAALGGGTPLSAYERAETLREMQAHLMSLIAAYREIGDDEPAAIASAIAQFGTASAVSVDLRRAEARNKIARLLRKNDRLLPAVLLPAFFYNLSLLLSFLSTTTRVVAETGGQTTHITSVPVGWQALLFLQFFCGVLNANVSKKWSLHGLFMGYAAALGAFTLLDTVFGGPNPALRNAMFAGLVPWLGCACLGILFAHVAHAARPKKWAA